MTSRQRKARGKLYRQLRERAGLTRPALAKQMGLKDVSAVAHWERGAARPRDLVKYARLCRTDLETILAAG